MPKTVTYSYVLQKTCELTGRVYPPSTEEASFFRTFIGTALRQAWEAFDWPEQTVTQQEFFARTYSASTNYSVGTVVYFPTEQEYYQVVNSTGSSSIDPTTGGPDGTLNAEFWALAQPSYSSVDGTWDSTVAYSVGQIVLYAVDQQYYQCVAATSPGTDPTNVAFWGVLNPFLRYVSQTDNPDGTARSAELGEIFAVTAGDPRVVPNQTLVQYGFTPSGLLVVPQLPFVWINARLQPPVYTSDPSTIPYRFADICAYRAAGQMLRVDGKVDLGNEFMVLGESALADEIDKVARQEMQTRQIVVPTR